MHLLMQVTVKSTVFGRFCFARAYRDRSETYRQRNINIKHTVPIFGFRKRDDLHWRIQPPVLGGGGQLAAGSQPRVSPKLKTPRI